MKIAQIFGGNEDGGLEKHVIELSRSLKNKGIDVTVIAHPRYKNMIEPVKFISLDLTKGRYNIFVLFKLYKIIQNNNFNIIHAHASKAVSMIATLKNFFKIPTIATLHSYKNKLQAFEKMDFVITVSDEIGKKLKNNNKFTIYNGIKQEQYKEKNNNNTSATQNKHFTVCTVGRLVKVKQIETLIIAFKDIDAKLIIVGDGPEKNHLENLVKDLSITDKVTFTGNLSSDSVSNILFRSHLFVMTSKKEGFPYTFIEAMFHNLPFISTPVSDIEKFIGHDFIVPHNSPEELANKIRYIQNNYNDTLSKFNPIFKKTQAILTLEHMTSETIKIYNKFKK
jgi:glycosyltransferase involved in cell wall biosynthesis